MVSQVIPEDQDRNVRWQGYIKRGYAGGPAASELVCAFDLRLRGARAALIEVPCKDFEGHAVLLMCYGRPHAVSYYIGTLQESVEAVPMLLADEAGFLDELCESLGV